MLSDPRKGRAKMQVKVQGEFLSSEPTKSGKGYMVSVLQANASCELYCPNDAQVQFPPRMTPVEIEAIVRPGYEGRGFQATVRSVKALAGSGK
jgi:hypothetical protein